jgi:hypothetical protein
MQILGNAFPFVFGGFNHGHQPTFALCNDGGIFLGLFLSSVNLKERKTQKQRTRSALLKDPQSTWCGFPTLIWPQPKPLFLSAISASF